MGWVIIPLSLESEQQPVKRQFEKSLWVVLNPGSLHSCKRWVATVGKRGLGIAVLGLTA